MPSFVPEGFHSITPRLVASDPAGLVRFLKEAFDARGEFAADVPAQLRIGDSIVMVSGAGPRKRRERFCISTSPTRMRRIGRP